MSDVAPTPDPTDPAQSGAVSDALADQGLDAPAAAETPAPGVLLPRDGAHDTREADALRAAANAERASADVLDSLADELDPTAPTANPSGDQASSGDTTPSAVPPAAPGDSTVADTTTDQSTPPPASDPNAATP